MRKVKWSYHAADVAHVTEVPAHDGLVVVRSEELEVAQFRSTSSRIVLHVQADPGGDAQPHLQSGVVQLHHKHTMTELAVSNGSNSPTHLTLQAQ
jgi:hypothetical protein